MQFDCKWWAFWSLWIMFIQMRGCKINWLIIIYFSIDPFTRKDWYDVKAPSMFTNRQIGKTLVNRTQGTRKRILYHAHIKNTNVLFFRYRLWGFEGTCLRGLSCRPPEWARCWAFFQEVPSHLWRHPGLSSITLVSRNVISFVICCVTGSQCPNQLPWNGPYHRQASLNGQEMAIIDWS